MEKQISTKGLKIMNKYNFPWGNIQFSEKPKMFGPKQFFSEKIVASYDVHSVHQREKHFLISFVDPVIPNFLA